MVLWSRPRYATNSDLSHEVGIVDSKYKSVLKILGDIVLPRIEKY